MCISSWKKVDLENVQFNSHNLGLKNLKIGGLISKVQWRLEFMIHTLSNKTRTWVRPSVRPQFGRPIFRGLTENFSIFGKITQSAISRIGSLGNRDRASVQPSVAWLMSDQGLTEGLTEPERSTLSFYKNLFLHTPDNSSKRTHHLQIFLMPLLLSIPNFWDFLTTIPPGCKISRFPPKVISEPDRLVGASQRLWSGQRQGGSGVRSGNGVLRR